MVENPPPERQVYVVSEFVESMAATGRADSVPLAGQWSEMPVPHATTALWHLPSASLVGA